MPKAAVSLEPRHFELKSCPPDGYVDLKPMSFGQKLHRQELASEQSVTENKDGNKMDMRIQHSLVAQYEFRICIVGHNLEKDDEGNLYDFSDPASLGTLDPRIGDEINNHINALNNFEDEVKEGN